MGDDIYSQLDDGTDFGGIYILMQMDEDVTNVFKQGDQLLRKGYAFATGTTNPNFAKHNARVFNPLLDDGLEASTKFTLNGGKAAQEMVDDVLQLSNDKLTKEILETKPKNSPIPQKWLDKGGRIDVDMNKIPPEWIYTDWEGNVVHYVDGFPDFKTAGLVDQEVVLKMDLIHVLKILRKQGMLVWGILGTTIKMDIHYNQ